MSNSSDENRNPFEQEAELEALSQQMSAELSIGGVSRFEELLKQAKKAARRAAFWCRLIPNEYPFALREYAEVQVLLGNVAKAKKYFDKSIRVAEKQGASYEADLSRYARAQLDKQSAEPGSESIVQEAEKVIRDHQLQIDRVLHRLGLVEHRE